MGDWRFALSRFRFSWVELLGVICVVRLIDSGRSIVESLFVLIAFLIAQAVLIAWPQ